MSEPASNPDSKPILLVVDDEEGPRASLKVVFKNDYNVLLASNGPDALKLAREHTIDIAILDILMQGMSGVDVLRELKVLDEDIEVMMLTAYETLDTARQALRLGAREYLNKPFDIPSLREAAAKALARRRNTRDLKAADQRIRDLQVEIQRAPQLGGDAGTVVHDLNNPLTVISGYVELLNRQIQSAAKVEGEELNRVKDNIARVKSQMDRCVEISRRYLGSRRRDPNDRCSVNQVLFDVRELLLKHPCAEGNSIVMRELEAPIHTTINATDFLRILLNLTLNALQASAHPHIVEVVAQFLPPGTGVRSFSDTESERFVSASQFPEAQSLTAVSIIDTGAGIPPDIVRRLFNEQITTKPLGKGTGLGLGSVRDLVIAAGGAIHMITKLDHGTTFTVFIPAA